MFLGIFLILVSCECFVTILSRHITGFLGLVRVFPEVQLLFLLSFIYFSFSPLFPLGLFHRILQPFYLCPFVISKSLLFEKMSDTTFSYWVGRTVPQADCPMGEYKHRIFSISILTRWLKPRRLYFSKNIPSVFRPTKIGILTVFPRASSV